MKKLLSIFFILVLSLGAISCSLNRDDPNITFYHPLNLEDRYFFVVSQTPEEIEFRIGLSYRPNYLYHMIFDEEEERISEGWIWTRPIDTDYYTFKMKPKEGYSFDPGERYSLCIGHQNPNLVYYHTNKYGCIALYEFVLPE